MYIAIRMNDSIEYEQKRVGGMEEWDSTTECKGRHVGNSCVRRRRARRGRDVRRDPHVRPQGHHWAAAPSQVRRQRPPPGPRSIGSTACRATTPASSGSSPRSSTCCTRRWGGRRGRRGRCRRARPARRRAIRPLLRRRRSTSRRRRRRPPPVYRHLHSTVAVASSLAVATGCAYSRVYLGYHTIPQVAIGSALGSSVGAAWYALFNTAVVRSSLVRWDGMPAG